MSDTTWHRIAVGASAATAAFIVFVMLAPDAAFDAAVPVLRVVGVIGLVVALVVSILVLWSIAAGPIADEMKFRALTDPKHRTTDRD